MLILTRFDDANYLPLDCFWPHVACHLDLSDLPVTWTRTHSRVWALGGHQPSVLLGGLHPPAPLLASSVPTSAVSAQHRPHLLSTPSCWASYLVNPHPRPLERTNNPIPCPFRFIHKSMRMWQFRLGHLVRFKHFKNSAALPHSLCITKLTRTHSTLPSSILATHMDLMRLYYRWDLDPVSTISLPLDL